MSGESMRIAGTQTGVNCGAQTREGSASSPCASTDSEMLQALRHCFCETLVGQPYL